ncbi:MAG TPA: hypothetical protein VHV83_22220 [Armatimonadota bacterium]|nr:hypothetical protein [Armatimonadota bacterium]
MKRTPLYLLPIALLLCFSAFLPVKASEADEQREVAKRFIVAYFLQDIKTVRDCVPDNKSLLFSPYPFASAPKLAQPKVHKTQALIEFTAPMLDGKFPAKGGIVLHEKDKIWKVRQVIFYNKIPLIFGLPSRSVSREDRAQEGHVRQVGEDFMRQWRENDQRNMLALWHNWVATTPDPVDGLTVTNFKSSVSTTPWRDPYVSYTVKVSYHWGPLSYSMTTQGGIMLVKENGEWKVRANHFIFNF